MYVWLSIAAAFDGMQSDFTTNNMHVKSFNPVI